MTPYLRWFRARPMATLAPGMAVLVVSVVIAGDLSVTIDSPWQAGRQRHIPWLEIGPVVMAGLLGYGCRPRLWHPEHLSVRRLGLPSGGLALLAAALPAATTAVAATRFPEAGDRGAYVAIILTTAAISLALGPMVTPAGAWSVPLFAYLMTVVVQTTWPGWSQDWWPLPDPRTPAPERWPVPAIALTIALLVQMTTRGATRRSARL